MIELRTGESRRLLWKVPEVAEMLSLAPSYVWRLTQNGELPVVRIGRSVRVRATDLERFIDERSQNVAA